MFDKLMNNYYFGKSGKGDFTEDDLPTNRWQLFMQMLRVRFSALVRLNLMNVVVWLPLILVLMFSSMSALQTIQYLDTDGSGVVQYVTRQEDGTEVVNEEQALPTEVVRDRLQGILAITLMLMVPCIAITGPVTAGVSYVTRNWARDEHAFIWSDFKDAVKANWKQSLAVSAITSVIPLVVYYCWIFYGDLAETQVIMVLPQVLILMLGIVWMLAVTYMHPMIVSYQLRLRDVLRNSLLLAVARLPFSVGIRLLHCMPMVLGVLIAVVFNVPQYVVMALFLYYVLIGYALSRFVSASYTNGVFEKYINSRIEGAPVNKGLRVSEEDEDDEEDEEEDEDDE